MFHRLLALLTVSAVAINGISGDVPCGVQAPGNEPIGTFGQSSYINGGIHAKPHSWPWAAAVLNDQGTEPLEFCGGTIVSKRWILSAGHCAPILTSGIHIKLGADDRGTSSSQTNEPNQQIFKVEKAIAHPKFNSSALTFDFSLARLDRDIEFNDFVRPVCLPSSSDSVAVGENVITIGWGYGGPDGTVPEHHHLQQLKIPVISAAKCNVLIQQYYPGGVQVDPSIMVCAGIDDITNTTGVYGGDSGSALMSFRDNTWKQFGVTSWRYRFNPYLPAVWSYVPPVVDWIQQTIQTD